MPLTLAELFASPNHYLHSIEGDSAVFVPMDRAAYHRSIFLDARIAPAGDGTMHVPLTLLTRNIPPASTASWIFHVAHCGSTLLARALDRVAGNLVLREPLALRQVALDADHRLVPLVRTMVAKRYRPDAPTVIKANVPVNFILGDLLAGQPGERALFLYLGLDEYLLAVLRTANHRAWLQRICEQLHRHLGKVAPATDAERAGALWAAQMQAFREALAVLPHGRTLSGEAFLNAPGRVLMAVAAQLDVELPPDDLRDILEGPLFSTYSKNPAVAFDNAERLARAADTASALATEVRKARAWIERHVGSVAALEDGVAVRAVVA